MARAPTIRFRPRRWQEHTRSPNDAGALRPAVTSRNPAPAAFTPAPRDELDAEIDAALSEGRPVDMAAAFPNPPPPGPAGAPDPVLTPEPADIPGQPGHQAAYYNVRPGATDADGDTVPGNQPDNMTPAQRLRHVGVIAPTYLDEYRSRLLHRLLMRRLPLDVIAAQLQCSVRNVQVMKTKLRKRLARQAMSMSVYDVAGETVAFFNEVRGLAMQQVSNTNVHIKDRQYAMRIAMEAQNDIVRFLSASGYFDATPYVVERGKNDDPKQTTVDQTLSMLAAVMSPDTSEADIASFFESDALGEEQDLDGMDPNTDVMW